MNEPAKLCPLSFGFSFKQEGTNITNSAKVNTQIHVGFPCQEERCSWWLLMCKECVIPALLTRVERLLELKERIE